MKESDLKILLAIAEICECADDWVSIPTLVKHTGLSRVTIHERTKVLVSGGYLKTHKSLNRRSFNIVGEYYPIFKKLKGADKYVENTMENGQDIR